MVYLPSYSSSIILFNLDNILNHQLIIDQCITSEISPIQPFLPLNRPILDLKQKTKRMCVRKLNFLAYDGAYLGLKIKVLDIANYLQSHQINLL